MIGQSTDLSAENSLGMKSQLLHFDILRLLRPTITDSMAVRQLLQRGTVVTLFTTQLTLLAYQLISYIFLILNTTFEQLGN